LDFGGAVKKLAVVARHIVEDGEELFHPIDLDAILEGRRAAGE